MVDTSVDMLEQAKALLQHQHQAQLDPAAFSAREALDVATSGNARALGLDREIGSIELGKRADVAVFDLRGAHVGVVHDPIVSLVTAARGADARWVVADGVVRVDDGRLVDSDYAAVRADAVEAARRLLD
jgi:5-methylthioadenosine/S-adenosylhomocysteine deaminase